LAKYRTGKSQYQARKKELEKLSGKLKVPCLEMLQLPFRFSNLHFQVPPRSSPRLRPSWPTQLSANEVVLLKQKHAEELQGLRTQVARAQELETELAKAREVESKLWLEFDQRLAQERKILAAKYDSKLDELWMSLSAKVESRDAKIVKLETLRRLDDEKHKTKLSLWHARDRKL
jgi:hypothetical protein